MNLLILQNTLKFIVDNTDDIAMYHCGFADDINRNIDNDYNQNNQVGTKFPFLQWVAPIEGILDLKSNLDRITIDLHLYDLLHNTGDDILRNDTYIKKWNRLKTTLAEIALTLKNCKNINIAGDVKYWTDAAINNDNLIVVCMKFDVIMRYDCKENFIIVPQDVIEDATRIITDNKDNEVYEEQ